jgi:hypothetical protein
VLFSRDRHTATTNDLQRGARDVHIPRTSLTKERPKRHSKSETAAPLAKVERPTNAYAGAFARVRLVRAWIAAVAALVTMLYGYVTLLERVIR